MYAALERAAANMVAGNTKVVERGKADGTYITMAGIASPEAGVHLDTRLVRPGDKLLLSGTTGDHGMIIPLARITRFARSPSTSERVFPNPGLDSTITFHACSVRSDSTAPAGLG
jgi:hydrogenase maturation factor